MTLTEAKRRQVGDLPAWAGGRTASIGAATDSSSDLSSVWSDIDEREFPTAASTKRSIRATAAAKSAAKKGPSHKPVAKKQSIRAKAGAAGTKTIGKSGKAKNSGKAK